jgi:multiple sugar transport system permease protein
VSAGVTALPRLSPARKRTRRAVRIRRWVTVLILMSPWIIGFLAFTAYPMIASFYFSFTHYNLLSPPQWVGLANYRFMMHDPYFWLSLRNTVWIVLYGVTTQILFAIVIATLVLKPRRGIRLYRTVFYMPTIAPIVAATLGFLYLFNPATGPVNQLLRLLHLPAPLWFYDPQWAKPGLLFLGLWGVGNTMIIFLAALIDVPQELYEVADLEGGSRWQKFRYVTLPMISPVIFFAVVVGVIYGFQYFTEAFVASTSTTATGAPILGAPQGSTLFYSIWLYQQGFMFFHMGYASAMAWILLLVTLACIVVLLRTSRRWVHYQGGFLGR